jgi:hypothetical protein
VPLKKARRKTKRAIRKAVSANMHELSRPSSTPRPRKQKIAIALRAAGAPKKRKRR